MEKSWIEILAALAPFVPLFQTFLWVLLCIGLLLLFRKRLKDLLDEIQKRLADGSSVKTPWLELGVPSQEEKAAKLDNEIEEVTKEIPASRLADTNNNSAENFRSHYEEVESLALDAIAKEYNATINKENTRIRNSNVIVDGAFSINQILYIIEVKYILRPIPITPIIGQLHLIRSTLLRDKQTNVKIILVLVFDMIKIKTEYKEELIAKLRQELFYTDTNIPVIIRDFSLQFLKSRLQPLKKADS
ncbi:hypothetical protein [Neisseria sp. CCUG12390]|uniref:hypothetical protein n=1 Tax=Neisseria sp. CCUG12390 TaxID=3392035 RepID=UPI003A0FE45E